MSFRLRDTIDKSNLPGIYKRTLGALATFANNDGTNIFCSKESAADKSGVSRWTTYRHIVDLLVMGVLKEADSHSCKNPKCSGGRLHFTARHGHYTVVYGIDLAALARLPYGTKKVPTTVAKRQNPTVAPCNSGHCGTMPKDTVAKCDATQSLGSTLPVDLTPSVAALHCGRPTSDSPTNAASRSESTPPSKSTPVGGKREEPLSPRSSTSTNTCSSHSLEEPSSDLESTPSDSDEEMTEAEMGEYESMITLCSMWWSLHPEMYFSSNPYESEVDEEPSETLEGEDPFAEPDDDTLNASLAIERKLEPILLADEATMMELLRTRGFEPLYEFFLWLPKSNNWFQSEWRIQSLDQLRKDIKWGYIQNDMKKYYANCEAKDNDHEEYVQQVYLDAGGVNAEAIAWARLNPIAWNRADALEEWAADVTDDLFGVDASNPFAEQDAEDQEREGLLTAPVEPEPQPITLVRDGFEDYRCLCGHRVENDVVLEAHQRFCEEYLQEMEA